ncbi:MAG: prepilin-type N-terminal cleavage/methylation domain-containing protein, partial [Betaproteobacteria bacterium]
MRSATGFTLIEVMITV